MHTFTAVGEKFSLVPNQAGRAKNRVKFEGIISNILNYFQFKLVISYFENILSLMKLDEINIGICKFGILAQNNTDIINIEDNLVDKIADYRKNAFNGFQMSQVFATLTY